MSRHNLRYGPEAPGPAWDCLPARRIQSPSAPSHPAQGKIGGDIHIFGANPLPNSIEVKWEGAGIDTDWTVPTNTVVRRNEQLAFHMGWVAFQPGKLDETEVRFSSRFWWDDEQYGATWIWYLVPHAPKQGIWERNHQKGSGVNLISRIFGSQDRSSLRLDNLPESSRQMKLRFGSVMETSPWSVRLTQPKTARQLKIQR